MAYKLKDLIDIPKLQSLLDTLDEIYSLPSAIIDTDGNILTATAWQDICTKFHRINPETEKKCKESDSYIAKELHNNPPNVVYRCPLGLIDTATPIIVEGHHLGNVFTGQLFLEPPDRERFISQARQYSFNEKDYLAALNEVPIISEERLRMNLKLLREFTQMVATQGLIHKRQLLTEEALKEKTERLKLATDSAKLGVWDWDVINNHMTWDDRMLELYGYTRESFPGGIKAWTRSLHPEDRDRTWEECQQALRGESAWDTEFRVLHPDGKVLYIKADGLAIRDNDGKPLRMLGINYDITERKRMEDELRRREGQYRQLVEMAPDGVFELDAQGTFIYANDAICRMLGYTREELLTHNIFETYKEDEKNNGRERFALIPAGKSIQFQRDMVRKDGSTIAVSASAIKMGDGRVQAIVRDISEHMKLEEQLRHSQKMEAIGTLAGGIAHDFNNLLQGIFGYISLAKMSYEHKKKSLSMLEQAEQALHIAVNLTNQLLTFSKGGKPFKKTISLKSAIENAIRFGLSGSKCKYVMNFEDNLWMADADEGQIGQVIQNIVINADQSMPEGGYIHITVVNVRVSAKDHIDLPEGKYLRISIEDMGIGIPGKYLQKIFDPYFTTKEKGSGLGLATSYSIVKNHGGIIDVSSEIGKGTAFVIYLPAIEGKSETQAQETISTEGRKGRILFMDDEEVIRNVAQEQIRLLGHDVELAKDGDETIRKYRDEMKSGRPFDAVILDLTIRGGIGGEETLRRLLKIDPEVKCIVSSGYYSDSAVADYKKIGFKASLKKPYNIEYLRDTISTLLR